MKARRIATRGDMARIARGYDTTLSRAMLRALGLPPPTPRSGTVAARRPSGAYAGMGECFANERRVRV